MRSPPLPTTNSLPVKLHVGLRGLLEYTALLIVAGIAYFAYTAMTETPLTQVPMLLGAGFLLVIWLVFVLFGFFERRAWAWLGSLACFSAVLAYSLLLHYYLLAFSLIPFELFLLLSLFSILMNGTVLWYVFQKKKYFTNPHYIDHFGVTDQLFVNILLCLVVLLFAISFTVLKFLK